MSRTRRTSNLQVDTHMRGENVPGARVTALEDIQPRQIREAEGLSQAEFARLIGMPVKTLQWEQKRTRPTGPARALLNIVEPIRSPLFKRCMLLASRA